VAFNKKKTSISQYKSILKINGTNIIFKHTFIIRKYLKPTF
jgi:hypothetical protein